MHNFFAYNSHRGPEERLVVFLHSVLEGSDLLRGYRPEDILQIRDGPLGKPNRELVVREEIVEHLVDPILDDDWDATARHGVHDPIAPPVARGGQAEERRAHLRPDVPNVLLDPATRYENNQDTK